MISALAISIDPTTYYHRNVNQLRNKATKFTMLSYHMIFSPLDLSLSVSLPDPMDELPLFFDGAAIAENPDLRGSTNRIKNVEPAKRKKER